MIAWGLLDCFFGYKIFKYSILILGAVTGALLGGMAGQALSPGDVTGQMIGLVAGALLGGTLAFLLYLAMVFFAGMLFGLTLGMLLFSNYNATVAFVAGCGLGLLGGFLAVKLQQVVLILSTALLGSFRALLALMFFTHHLDWAFYLSQQPQQIPALIDSNAWLLPATLALAAIGAVAQFDKPRDRSAKKERSPDA